MSEIELVEVIPAPGIKEHREKTKILGEKSDSKGSTTQPEEVVSTDKIGRFKDKELEKAYHRVNDNTFASLFRVWFFSATTLGENFLITGLITCVIMTCFFV